MSRLLRLVVVVLPVALALAALVMELSKGQPHPVTLGVAIAAAACLGLTLAYMLRAVALLSGTLDDGERSRRRRIAGLEADLGALQRTLSGVELDAGMKRVEGEEAEELAAPLRQRAEVLAAEIAQLRGLESDGVDGEIDQEVQRRLAARRLAAELNKGAGEGAEG